MKLLRRSRPDSRPLSCREVGRLLQAFLDDQSDPVTARRVAAHLDDCRRCGLEATVYREMKRALRHQAPPVPEPALRRLRRFGDALANDTG